MRIACWKRTGQHSGLAAVEKQIEKASRSYKQKMPFTLKPNAWHHRVQCISVDVYCNIIHQYYDRVFDSQDEMKTLMNDMEEKAKYDDLTAVQRKFVIPGILKFLNGSVI